MAKRYRILFLRKGYITEPECRRAFLDLGQSVESLTVTDYEPRHFLDLLVARKAEYDFIFTINSYGFDEQGVVSATLRDEKIRVVSWEVDHPYFFYVFGKRTVFPGGYLVQFVWDEGYIADLHDRGFEQAYYLPNASSPQFVEAALQRPAPDDLTPERLRDKGTFVGTNLLDFIKTFLEENLDFNLFPTDRHQQILDVLARRLLGNTELSFPELFEQADEGHALSSMAESEKYRLIAELLVSSEYRTRILRSLPEISVYGGSEWENILAAGQYQRQLDYYSETPHVYQNSAININLTLTKNRFDSNQRIFDIPLCGGFLLTDRKRNLRRHFVEGEEMVSFGSVEELRELISYYHNNPEQRSKITQRARERILKEHTYKHRMRVMLDRLERL